MDAENRLCVLFADLTTLRLRLTMAVFDTPTPRLAMQHHMTGLGRDEIAPYVQARLTIAGAPADLSLFEAAVIETLYLSSNGLLRLINTITHYALIAACGAGAHGAAGGCWFPTDHAPLRPLILAESAVDALSAWLVTGESRIATVVLSANGATATLPDWICAWNPDRTKRHAVDAVRSHRD